MLTTLAVSSTNLGPVIIFASCVIHWPLVLNYSVVSCHKSIIVNGSIKYIQL